MKKISIFQIFLFLLPILLFSCREEAIIQPNNLKASSLKRIDFKGETVLIDSSINPELLVQTNEEFLAYLNSFTNSNARLATNSLTLSLQETVEIIDKYKSKYPDLSWEKDLSKQDVKRIFKDFQSITSEDEIREKSDLILSFYNGLLKIEVLPELINTAKNKKKTRSINVSIGDMNPYESSIVWNHPVWASSYFAAGQQALNAAGYATDGTKMNAVQHSTWNCFIIKKVILSGGSKSSAVTYARETTSAHEWNSEGTSKLYSDHTAMDLHNNMTGRTWMDENTSWGVLFLRKMPSDNAIISWMTDRANEAGNWQNTTNILGFHSNSWDKMYNDNLWSYPGAIPFLVYIIN